MFYKQTIKAKTVIDRVETAVEALNVSVNEFGYVNLRIKVILKNEPRLESEIVMEKAKRLYEYIAEHSDLQKEISNILPDDIISNILNGSLPVFPHEDLGIIVDENELIHYMNHAVLYKEVGDSKSECLAENNGTRWIC